MTAWIDKAQSGLATACFVLAGGALAVMVMLISANVLGRWVLGEGVRGTEELSRFLMVASVYLGLAGACGVTASSGSSSSSTGSVAA